jgi:hypothetical protein
MCGRVFAEGPHIGPQLLPETRDGDGLVCLLATCTRCHSCGGSAAQCSPTILRVWVQRTKVVSPGATEEADEVVGREQASCDAMCCITCERGVCDKRHLYAVVSGERQTLRQVQVLNPRH